MARRNPEIDAALLSGNIERIFKILDRERAARAHYEATRPITAHDIKVARMRRARGMDYNKRALGED